MKRNLGRMSFGRLVGRCVVGRLVAVLGRLVVVLGRLVNVLGRLVGWLVGWLVGRYVLGW